MATVGDLVATGALDYQLGGLGHKMEVDYGADEGEREGEGGGGEWGGRRCFERRGFERRGCGRRG